jgi:hypothetical protein
MLAFMPVNFWQVRLFNCMYESAEEHTVTILAGRGERRRISYAWILQRVCFYGEKKPPIGLIYNTNP